MKHVYRQLGVPDEEKVENPLEYMEQLGQKHLLLSKRGFKETARFITTSPKLIYDSEWCRVKFLWDGWEMYNGNSISIFYGRIHAPDDSPEMKWKGEECYCWHEKTGITPVLDFLDGLSPQESAARKGFPKVIEEMRQTEWFHDMVKKRQGPELAVRMEAKIWDHYDIRLFELFDLRRPNQWENYREWLKARYNAEGKSQERDRQFGILIPYYQVC